MQDVHGSREHDACEHVAFLAQDACCWEQDGGCVKQDVHSGREHDMTLVNKHNHRHGMGECAHHNVDSEVWPVLDVHFEGVVKSKSNVALEPVGGTDVIEGQVESREHQANSTR